MILLSLQLLLVLPVETVNERTADATLLPLPEKILHVKINVAKLSAGEVRELAVTCGC